MDSQSQRIFSHCAAPPQAQCDAFNYFLSSSVAFFAASFTSSAAFFADVAAPLALSLTPSPASFAASLRSSARSEEHTSELQSRGHLVCRLLLEKKKDKSK